jgi:hypothetical protein
MLRTKLLYITIILVRVALQPYCTTLSELKGEQGSAQKAEYLGSVIPSSFFLPSSIAGSTVLLPRTSSGIVA